MIRLGAFGAGTALATLGTTGCDWLAGRNRRVTRKPDPLEPLLAGTVALADRYDAALVQAPALAALLTPIRDDHRAHAATLASLIGKKPGPGPSGAGSAAASAPASAAAVRTDLAAAETQAHDQAIAACLAAPGDRAAVLGSIAACRATHIEALR